MDKEIVVDGEEYLWSKFNDVNARFYVINSSGKKLSFLCEDHYHNKNHDIVDVDMNSQLVEYIIKNMSQLDSVMGFYSVPDTMIEKYYTFEIREKKLKRILKKSK